MLSENQPLAARMRPTKRTEIIGHDEILSSGTPLAQLMDPNSKNPPSVILWGSAGSGKTTIAHVIAKSSNRAFVELSAVSAGVKDIRSAITMAKKALEENGEQTILFVDEVHRFSKSQQDILLPAVENGDIIFMAATTENPAFSVIGPLKSRSLTLKLTDLDEQDIIDILVNAVNSENGLNRQFDLANEELSHIARLSNNDARQALTILEAAANTAKKHKDDKYPLTIITATDIESVAQTQLATWSEDDHYDIISAFIKSIRGSDPQAAVFYLAKMLNAGEDPRFIARRLVIHASEDIGLADNTALLIANAALNAVEKIGMPEARITLTHATIALATAPKSPSVIKAISHAMDDVQNGAATLVPLHLRDAHYKTAKLYGYGAEYKYPHDYPFSMVSQQYLPDNKIGTIYYHPTDNGEEKVIKQRLNSIKNYLKTRNDQI